MAGARLPLEQGVDHLLGPARLADEIVAGEQDLFDAQIAEVLDLLDDQLRRLVVRPVVVREDADVAELAQERTAARHLEHRAIVAVDRRIHQRAVHRARLADLETRLVRDHALDRLAAPQVLEQRRDRLLAVADIDVVEAVELGEVADLVERPADRPADHRHRVREPALQFLLHADQVAVVLVDAAEQEDVGRAERIELLHPGVEQRELEAAVLRDVRGERIGPDRHELRAVVLRIGVDRVGAVDETDAQHRPLGRGQAYFTLWRQTERVGHIAPVVHCSASEDRIGNVRRTVRFGPHRCATRPDLSKAERGMFPARYAAGLPRKCGRK